MTDRLAKLRRLRDWPAVPPPIATSRRRSVDIDRSLRRVMAELDRRDGPGAGEAALAAMLAESTHEGTNL